MNLVPKIFAFHEYLEVALSSSFVSGAKKHGGLELAFFAEVAIELFGDDFFKHKLKILTLEVAADRLPNLHWFGDFDASQKRMIEQVVPINPIHFLKGQHWFQKVYELRGWPDSVVVIKVYALLQKLLLVKNIIDVFERKLLKQHPIEGQT